MPLFGKAKDHTDMLKIGPFWYPKAFYLLADSNMTGPALKRHFEFSLAMENYNYLMGIRTVTKRNAIQFCFRFVKSGGPEMVNVSFDQREATLEAVGALFPAEGQLSRLATRRMHHALQGGGANNGTPAMVHAPTVTRDSVIEAFSATTTGVNDRVSTDLIGVSAGGKFWKSTMFMDLHKWRMDHYYRRHVQKIPAVRLADRSFAAAQQERINNRGVGATVLTEAERAQAMAEWDEMNTY